MAYWNFLDLTWKFLVKPFCIHILLILLEVQLVSHRLNTWLMVQETATQSLNGKQFNYPSDNIWVLRPHQHLGFLVFLILVISVNMKWCLIKALICIFLVNNNVQGHSTRLLSIFLSPSMKYIFLIDWFFSLLICRSFLFETCAHRHIYVFQIFPTLWLNYSFFKFYLFMDKIFKFWWSPIYGYFFLFGAISFCTLRKLCLVQGCKEIHLCFLL